MSVPVVKPDGRTAPEAEAVFGGERMVGAPEKPADLMWAVEEPRRVDPPANMAEGVQVGKVRLRGCYKEAADYVVDHPGARLVHGTVSIGQQKDADGQGVPIAHAWAEIPGDSFGDVVYDGVQGQFYDKADYYAKMRAVAEQTYDRKAAVDKMLGERHYGPWGATGGIQRHGGAR